MDAALVLLADHELSASAMAARIAASAWADPYRVVLAGLGPLGVASVAGRTRPADRPSASTHAAHQLGMPRPNADFGLAALAYAMDMRRDAATTIFTVARIAGLIAHALEEYPHRLRFRPRASYIGVAPSS